MAHSREMHLVNEIPYGYIVGAFQIAYALGVMFAGRLVDRLGCRQGYPIVTGIWSLAAMWPRAGDVGRRLRRGALLPGARRKRKLSRGHQGHCGMVSAQGAGTRHRYFQLRLGRGRHPRAVPCSLGGTALWLARVFPGTGVFSATWIVWWSIRYRKPREAMDWSRRSRILPPAGPVIAWWRLLRYRQTWGFVLGKFLTDPVWWFYLFWMPSIFQRAIQFESVAHRTAVDRDLCTFLRGQRVGGWLPKGYVRLGMALKRGTAGRDAHLRMLVVPIAVAGGLHSEWTAVGLLSLAASAHQGWSANIFTTASDMFPAEYVGTVVSFGQVGGALGGAIFAAVAGNILQFTHSYVPLFLYSGFAYLVALLLLRTLAPGLKRAALES